MKAFKKPLALILSLALLIGMFPLQAIAAGSDQLDPSMNVDFTDLPSSLTYGSTFTTTVSVQESSEYDISAMTLRLNYDPTKLKVTGDTPEEQEGNITVSNLTGASTAMTNLYGTSNVSLVFLDLLAANPADFSTETTVLEVSFTVIATDGDIDVRPTLVAEEYGTFVSGSGPVSFTGEMPITYSHDSLLSAQLPAPHIQNEEATAVGYGATLSSSTITGEAYTDDTLTQPVQGTFTWKEPDVIITASGEHRCIFTPTGDDAKLFSPIELDANVVMNPTVINLIITDKTITYGDAIPTEFDVTLAANSNPLHEGDTIDDLNISFSTTALDGDVPDEYEISAEGGNPAYNVIFTNGRLTITQADVVATLSDISDEAYTGFEVEQSGMTITFTNANNDTITLDEDTDYTISYDNNIEAGTATVTVSSVLDSYYTFEGVSENFTIQPADIEDVNISEATSVLVGALMPTEDADHIATGLNSEEVYGTLSWYTDIELTQAVVVDATFDIAGSTTLYWQFVSDSGNYNTETGSLEFTATTKPSQTIVWNQDGAALPQPIEISLEFGGDSGSVITATSDEVSSATIAYTSSDENVVTVNSNTGELAIVGVGTATITATADETDDYATTTSSYTVTVAPMTITPTVAVSGEYTYTGLQITPEGGNVSVTFVNGSDTITLTETTDYTISYGENINSGAGTVTITEVDGSNYSFDTSVTTNFDIDKAQGEISISIPTPDTLDTTYTGAAYTDIVDTSLIIADKNGSDAAVFYAIFTESTGGVVIDDSTTLDAGTYYVQADMGEGTNHLGANSNRIPFIVEPAEYTVPMSYILDELNPTYYMGEAMPTDIDSFGAFGLTYPNPSDLSTIMSEVLYGTLEWFTDEACTSSAVGQNFSNSSAQQTLYWKFTPDGSDTNYVLTAKTGSHLFTLSTRPPQDIEWDAAPTGNEVTATYGDATQTYTATNNTTDGGSISYTSSDEAVVTVNANGEISFVGAGTATITALAASVDGSFAQTAITYDVTVNPKDITVTAENKTITFGDNLPEFTISVANGVLVGSDTVDDLNVLLTSNATDITPLNVASYNIQGTDADPSDNYDITVTSGFLYVEQASYPDQTKAVTAVYSNSAPVTVDLSSVYPTDAGDLTGLDLAAVVAPTIISSTSVDSSFEGFTFSLVTGLDRTSIGTSETITATVKTQNYLPFDVTITVSVTERMAQSLSFEGGDITKKDSDASFTNKLLGAMSEVSYESSNTRVATVDENGKVTIVSAGSATITATAKEDNIYLGSQASYVINVNPEKPADTGAISFIKFIFDIIFDEIEKFFFNGFELKLTPDGAGKLIISGYPGYEGEVGTIEEGSAIVTLNSDFLKALPKSQETVATLSIQNAVGEELVAAEVSLPSTEPTEPTQPTQPETDVPETGDTSNPMLLVGLVGISVVALAVLAMVMIKSKKAAHNKNSK